MYQYLVFMTVTEEFFGEGENPNPNNPNPYLEIGAVYIPPLKKRGVKKKSGVG